MKSIHKKLFSIGLLSAFLELALVHRAHAGLVGDLIGSVSSWVVIKILLVILGAISWIAQKIFMGGGMLIELAMRLNNTILDPNANIFLFKGWTVLVSVADLALVIALIIIAFATMLDFQTYGMKKALPRLIVIALLVNFSLVIPGVFIDMSGMVTEFFLKQSGLVGDGISSVLAGAFNISGFLETQNSGVASAVFEKLSFQAVGSMFFVVIFTMIGSIILLTMAILLFIRFFILTFMLVLTPVIFVAWIFPATKGHWDKWWNDFIRWTMFPPVMIFFVWLSLVSLNSLQGVSSLDPAAGTAAYAFKDGMAFGLGPVIQMAMAVMFMTMSLIAANGISINGAKGGKDMIGSMTNWGRSRIDKMGAYGKREAERAGRRVVARPVAAVGRGAAAMRKYEGEKGGVRGRVAGVAGRALGGATATQQAALKKTYDDKFKGMSDDDLATRYSTMAADEKVYAAQHLASKGKLGKINEKVLDRDIADKSTEKTFTKYGGEKAHGNFVKAAGRNKEMIDAKKAVDEAGTDMPKKAEAEKKYKEAAKKFYTGYSKKDYETLGSDFYKDGKYSNEALAALLKNEPGAIGSATKGIGKSADLRKFMEKVKQIENDVKKGVVESIKKTAEQKIWDGVAVELNAIMEELKASSTDLSKASSTRDRLEWIKEHDAKVFRNIGREGLETDIETQMKFLHARHNEAFAALPENEDYLHIPRMQESIRKSMGKRLYGGSEEKKEEKKA